MTLLTVNRAHLRPERGKRHVSTSETTPKSAKSEDGRLRFPVPAVISARVQKNPNANTKRAQASFLAQLSLQYDTIDVTRRIRREKLETAARSYSHATVITDQPPKTANLIRWA